MQEFNADYKKRAAEFNEKMGLSDPDDYWEDALLRFTVIAEEAGELMEAVNKGREDEIPEELADVVITVFTGADTLDIDMPRKVLVMREGGKYDDEMRDQVSDIFVKTAEVKEAIDLRNRDTLRASLLELLAECYQLSELYGIDLETEFHKKMDYNMRKSGEKVNGKPVDDVE